jgi:tetratricopeptide (TPR) repeat protein
MSHDDEQGSSDGVGDSDSEANTKDKKNAAFAQLVRRAKGSARSGDYEKATEHYRKALSLKRDADVAMQAARLLKQTSQHRDEAMLFARAAIRIDDEHTEARMLLGDVLEEMGRTDEAMAVYREVRELDRDHRDANRRLDTLADSSH